MLVVRFFRRLPLISIRFVDQNGVGCRNGRDRAGLRQFIQQGLGILAALSPIALARKPA